MYHSRKPEITPKKAEPILKPVGSIPRTIEPMQKPNALLYPSCNAPLKQNPPCNCEYCGILIE